MHVPEREVQFGELAPEVTHWVAVLDAPPDSVNSDTPTGASGE